MFNDSQKYGFRVLELVFGAFLMVAIFFGSKSAEAILAPVVTDFEVLSAVQVEEGIEVTGTMEKARDCTFRELMVYVQRDDQKQPVAASFEFMDRAKDLKTRAAIAQAWGPWKIFIPGEYDRADISLFARHECHSFYDTQGKLHEFTIVKENEALTVSNK